MNAPIYIFTNCVGGFRATVLKIKTTVTFMMNKTFKLSNKGRLQPWPSWSPQLGAALDSTEASPGVRAGVQRLRFWDGWGIPARKRLGFLWRENNIPGIQQGNPWSREFPRAWVHDSILHMVGTGQGVPGALRPLSAGAPRPPGQCFPTRRGEAEWVTNH